MADIPNLLRDSLKGSTHRVLALDPGETTGACVFEGHKLVDARQLQTGLMPLAAVSVRQYIRNWHIKVCGDPDINPSVVDTVVTEDYRVYSWKAKDHAWQGLHTPRLVGAIELICHDEDVQLVKQSAQIGKGFCTDDKLKAWGLYQVGERHARDAIRHAVQYLLFTYARIDKPLAQRTNVIK